MISKNTDIRKLVEGENEEPQLSDLFKHHMDQEEKRRGYPIMTGNEPVLSGSEGAKELERRHLLDSVDDFTSGYISAAMAHSTNFHPDFVYTENSIDLSTLREIVNDCRYFQEYRESYIAGWRRRFGGSLWGLGREMWLVRNQVAITKFGDTHDAKVLTNTAKEMGPYRLKYVNENGRSIITKA